MNSDARLVSEAAHGDKGAYRALFERYFQAVRRLASAFAELDADEVEDVVQESFVRAFGSLEKLRQPSRFGAWLFTIARNRCFSLLSRKQSDSRNLEELSRELFAAEASDGSLETSSAEAELEAVRALIESLPAGIEKETVRLFYLEGKLSAREIAERQGVGKSAVTMRLERFRAKIKRRLAARILELRGEEVGAEAVGGRR